MRKLLLILSIILSGCTHPSPQPPIPQPPIQGCVAVTVTGSQGLLDGATVNVWTQTAQTGDQHDPQGNVQHGYHYFYPLPIGLPTTITVTAKDYAQAQQSYTVPQAAPGSCDITIQLRPLFVPLPQLRVRDNAFFETVDGARFLGIESTDFNLLEIWLHDAQQADRVAQQRQDLGFNMVRVFTRYMLNDAGIGQITLAEHPDLYLRIPEFLKFLAGHKLYANLLAYPGGPPTQDYADDHWAKLCQASQGSTNVLLSLVNENDVHEAKVDTGKFQPCPGVLSSHGSNGSRSAPVQPVWDWAEAHWNNEIQWPRQMGHNGWEFQTQYHVAIHSDETRRAPDNDAVTDHWFDGGQNTALFIAAGTFHSVQGKNSAIFDDQTSGLAAAFVNGMRSIPLSCQGGGYVHRADLEQQMFSDHERADCGARVYQMGSDSHCLSVTHPICQ